MKLLTNQLEFPPLETASADGLLAVGGDLSPERLLLAYRSGIFPWYGENSPILWWSPNPRMVLHPAHVKVSKSMKKVMRSNRFSLTRNQCFDQVVTQCALAKRPGQEGTWITPEMKNAYGQLFTMGHAQSYEVWEKGHLVGGLYGVDLGHVFCGESMFSTVDNASKFAFITMARELNTKGYTLIDCQVHTPHLESLGAQLIPREEFVAILKGKDKGSVQKE
ncbi:MAG: leucyl/phenylalanyl-tRNA--protein transferase [Flavobacteriaceae bacterium]